MKPDQAKPFLQSTVKLAFGDDDKKPVHPVRLELTNAQGHSTLILDALDHMLEDGLKGTELEFWDKVYIAAVGVGSSMMAVKIADWAVRIRKERMTRGIPSPELDETPE